MLSTIFSLYTVLLWSSLVYCSARDTITPGNPIGDDGETLVSAGKRFELGFFTADGKYPNNSRYVGIWYYGSKLKTVVWVANRDHPLNDTSGVLYGIAEDGSTLKVLDNLERSRSGNRTAKLMDSGNLVLSDDDDESEVSIWQSFDYPTDTFLPGMKMDENMNLIAWKSRSDPGPGKFVFQQDQVENQYIINNRSKPYWKGGLSGKFISFNEMLPAIAYLLSNFSKNSSTYEPTKGNKLNSTTLSLDYNNTRLVMNFSGKIEYLRRDNGTGNWLLIWSEPSDACSEYNVCGDFGSCNSNYKNGLGLCKCLPGFKPSSPEDWNSGYFSGGCTRKSSICDVKETTFLSLKMMKVGNIYSQFMADSSEDCRDECLRNCNCQAYSYAEDNIPRRGTGSTKCWTWSGDLNNLQEEYADGGLDLYVRVAVSDIESTVRNCDTCGTNLIPYPLSTGPNCGDPMYFSFNCDTSTGQVGFRAPSGTYQVTRINAPTLRFVIKANSAASDCEPRYSRGNFLKLNPLLPFNVTRWCIANPGTFGSHMSSRGTDEVEIGWKPPQEPICTSNKDCKDWPDSTCNATGDGERRCLCNANFQWDGSSLNCTQGSGYTKQPEGSILHKKTSLSLIVVVTSTIGFVLVALSCTIVYISYMRRRRVARRQEKMERIQGNPALHLYDSERRVKELMDSGEFREDDKKGIDVPFFDLESILAITDNFSDANKLGQGGFGPVYKGKFPGGQEIAVKRLLSGSGQGFVEFKNEVVLIAKLQHRNLVRLLGYCVEGNEKILVYEYMPNKSLDSFIFDRTLCGLLNWETRFDIILGIARGILYLHQDSRLRIIHRDLKTSNVLLDEEMNPKVSDFGLARIFGGKQTEANTNRVVGTYGYMSPEYALDGYFSVKSDVFSFGVVVLEIISGKRNTGFYQSEQALSLLGHAWRLWKENKALDLMDRTLYETCNTNEFMKCINVGLLCVQEDPSDRPTMSNVVFMLIGETVSLPTPKQPAFIVRRGLPSTASTSSKPEIFSNNELTASIEEGR